MIFKNIFNSLKRSEPLKSKAVKKMLNLRLAKDGHAYDVTQL